jgi:hypothetical protein
LLVWTGALAQTVAPAVPKGEAKGFATITEAELRTDLGYIAGDKLQGRLSLQPGDETAIAWIVDAFEKAGLKLTVVDAAGETQIPFGNDKQKDNSKKSRGYLQSFALVEYRADRANTSVTLTRAGKEVEFHAPQAFGAFKHAVDVSAPVVFAGFGITAPELGYDDYKGPDGHAIDAKGKIVLVFDHEPQEDDAKSIFNGTGNTRYATTRVKLLNAQAHGAVALVVVAEPNRKHLTNAERAGKISQSTNGAKPITRTTPLPVQAIADDEITIPSITVLDAVAAELLATSGTTGSALQAAIDKNLTPQGRVLPDTVLRLHLKNVSERTGFTSNVAGLLEGSDPALKAETIIISGHHDHDGAAPCAPGEAGVDEQSQPVAAGDGCMQVWHGADDNGSGTVGVVELARAFAANGSRPKRSILFVVFASEERGLLGSYWMAAHPLRPLATTRAMINFDMIGRDEKASPQTDGLIEIPADTSNRLNLIGALYSPTYDKVVKEENAVTGLTLDDRFDHESALNVFFRSDQFPFVLHNVPAFWWFTGFHPDYHHTTDTVEKIDFAKMRKILELAYLTAWRFGSDAQTPVFVANPKP